MRSVYIIRKTNTSGKSSIEHGGWRYRFGPNVRKGEAVSDQTGSVIKLIPSKCTRTVACPNQVHCKDELFTSNDGLYTGKVSSKTFKKTIMKYFWNYAMHGSVAASDSIQLKSSQDLVVLQTYLYFYPQYVILIARILSLIYNSITEELFRSVKGNSGRKIYHQMLFTSLWPEIESQNHVN